MFKTKIIKILAIIVAVTGLVVVFGWIFDIGVIKSISPNWVTMKFSTALCFIASGIALYAFSEERKEGSFIVQVILPAALLLIFLLMATSFLSAIFKFSIGIDNFVIQEKAEAVKTVAPGRPSEATMLNFTLIAISGLLFLADFKKHFIWIGSVVGAIGVSALIGYIVNLPILYFTVPGISTAVALVTAILFMVIGIGLILCGNTVLKSN